MQKRLVYASVMLALVLSILPMTQTTAAEDLTGKVIKLEGSSTLYYVAADGKRYVFPNANTYNTWFADFSDVRVVTEAELSAYQLGGNIRYRPGVILVKIQTDPKVYAVGKNGTLRWLKNESIARQLYGDFWSKMIDDISAAFFANYTLGTDIISTQDFDPDNESDDSITIDEDRGWRIGDRSRHRLADTRRCKTNGPLRICRIDRDDQDDDEDAVSSEPGKQILVCHRTSTDTEITIRVGRAAVIAHLRHGDTLGRCDDDDDNDDEDGDDDGDDDNGTTTPDIIAPLIRDVRVNASTTSAIITWETNERANSKVTYATSTIATASSTQLVSSANLVEDHSLELSSLTASTTYYFLIHSADSAGNTATSSQRTFITD